MYVYLSASGTLVFLYSYNFATHTYTILPYVLSGTVLRCWNFVRNVFSSMCAELSSYMAIQTV